MMMMVVKMDQMVALEHTHVMLTLNQIMDYHSGTNHGLPLR